MGYATPVAHGSSARSGHAGTDHDGTLTRNADTPLLRCGVVDLAASGAQAVIYAGTGPGTAVTTMLSS